MSVRKRQALTDARTNKHLSREQLADATGVTKEHIRSLEYGRVKPSAQLMLQLCQVLGCTPKDIFQDLA